MGNDHEPTAVQRAYRQLISDYADLEPNHGFNDVTDVPTMTDADQSLTLRANPDILNEIELDAETLASILANGIDGSPFRTHWNLGSYIAFRMTAAVRKWVLSDLQQEEAANRNEQRHEREVEDYYGSARLMTTRELIARDCGVGRMFK